MKVRIEEIVKERLVLPSFPNKIEELPEKEFKNSRISRSNVLGLISEMKKLLDQEPSVVEAFVLAEIAGLPTLLVGPHGSGKTTLAKTLASSLTRRGKPLKFMHVTVKEVHTEYSVFARPDFGALARGEEKWIPKLVDAEFAFIDEIFRNHRIFAALNEILEEGRFEGLPLKWIFFAAATNPPNQYYRTVDILNYADLDRFAVIIEVEDRGLDFVDKMAENHKLELDKKLDISSIAKVRDSIRSVKVSPEASIFAKLLVGAFSICRYEPVRANSGGLIIYNKFSVINDLKCYRCVYQQHRLCSRFALAPKRAVRSLIALAKARAWVLKRCVKVEDIWWSARFTIPGRTAVVDKNLAEETPTYAALNSEMMKRFREWLEDVRESFSSGGENDPLVPVLRKYLTFREVEGYRVVVEVLDEHCLKRLAKWLVLKGTSTRRAAEIVEKLSQGISVIEQGYRIVRNWTGLSVEPFKNRREAEELCNFLKG